MRKLFTVVLFSLLLSVMPFLSFTSLVSSSSDNISDNHWITKASMNYKRANPGVVAVNDVIYVIGGDAGSVGGNLVYATAKLDPTVDITEAYEPVADTWTVKTTMPTARTLFATAVWNEKIYCIGGYHTSISYDKEWEYPIYTQHDTAVNEVYDPVLQISGQLCLLCLNLCP